MRVIPVPNQDDNYSYIIVDTATNKGAVVDTFDVKKTSDAIQKSGIELIANISTHHHVDHTGGNEEFLKSRSEKNLIVYGGSQKVPTVTKILSHGDEFKIGNLSVKALATPCHTQDSICYYVTDEASVSSSHNDEATECSKAVFTGDTLFTAGCGRFFEGTPEEMNKALNATLASLPDSTVVFDGHQYTKGSVKFGKLVDPKNEDIKALDEYAQANSQTCGKYTIGDEKKHNVFMRLSSDAVLAYAQSKSSSVTKNDPVEITRILREGKNNM